MRDHWRAYANHSLSAPDNILIVVDDLAADSLDFIELITAVEDTFKIEIPDEDAENMKTVSDALNYIESKR